MANPRGERTATEAAVLLAGCTSITLGSSVDFFAVYSINSRVTINITGIPGSFIRNPFSKILYQGILDKTTTNRNH